MVEVMVPLPPEAAPTGSARYCGKCGRPEPCERHREAKTFSKETQLARQTKRYHRKVASPKRWESIAESKQGPCRVCSAPAPSELHHLIPRSQGGSDTESNIVPLCHSCHQKVENRNATAGKNLAAALTDDEYAYCVDVYGEDFFERRLGVRYSR